MSPVAFSAPRTTALSLQVALLGILFSIGTLPLPFLRFVHCSSTLLNISTVCFGLLRSSLSEQRSFVRNLSFVR